jgi:hypothetical protein
VSVGADVGAIDSDGGGDGRTPQAASQRLSET